MARWRSSDIPTLRGRAAVVTGTGGLGLEDATQLARAGCQVTIAGRSRRKGETAVALIRATDPSADVRFEQVDLASLASIRAFATRLAAQRTSLDLLINNAAVMTPPTRQETSDGFELQLGTNYLGHFALTAQLMPLLQRGTQPRVVTLSSIASRDGAIDFDDLQSARAYAPMRAYSQSKLACLMFAFELQRRSEAARWGVSSLAAHPGVSRTDLLHNAPGRWSAAGLARSVLWFLFQPVARGALPTLFAATSPEARGGGYYGPDKMGDTRGFPAESKIPSQAEDRRGRARVERLGATDRDFVFGRADSRRAGERMSAIRSMLHPSGLVMIAWTLACGPPLVGIDPVLSAAERDDLQRNMARPEIERAPVYVKAVAEADLAVPLDAFATWFERRGRARLISFSASTARVSPIQRAEDLTGSFRHVGDRRRVVFGDGTTAVQEIVGVTPHQLEWVSWNLTNRAGRYLRYVVERIALSERDGHTHVRWTSSFRPRPFPDNVLIESYVHEDYTRVLESSLASMRAHALADLAAPHVAKDP